jgi:3-phosphoshikimate 1-carboxyvinyltransferase
MPDHILSISPPASRTITGSVILNGSKSISNRVLIMNALANGSFTLENLSHADDTVAMQKLLQSDAPILDAGAGGTTFRFLTAYLAIQAGRDVVLTGSERMQQRPIKILVDALRKLGADIDYVNHEGFPPLRIKGKKLAGGKITLPADTSSQYITALLLIAPQLESGLELELTGTIVSLPYIRMTLKLMQEFGIESSFTGNHIIIEPGQYQSKLFFVEADWSAASYFYSIAALSKEAKIELQGLTNQNIQGDSVIAEIARNFGVETTFSDRIILIEKRSEPKITSFQFDFLNCPDLTQTVVAMCAGLEIDMECSGLQTLRIKETDRIAALNDELFDLGLAEFIETGDNEWQLQNCQPQVFNHHIIRTYEDHRMAMAFAPLCLKTGALQIADPQVVSKSYPKFWEDLKNLDFQID